MLRPSDSGCRACPLWEGRTHIVNGAGRPDAQLVVIGEAPGAEEDKVGVPFVGKSGKLLKATLSENGFPGNTVYLTNVVKCRPPENRDPTPAEIQACSGWLADELLSLQPAGILALGKFAQKAVQDARSNGIIPENIQIFNAWHPAYILRSPRHRKAWHEQIMAAGLALGTVPENVEAPRVTGLAGRYREEPPDESSPWFSADTETDDLEEGYGVRTVGYSVSDGVRAMFYDVGAEHGREAGNLLGDRVKDGRKTWLWNAKYDAPALGIDLYRPELYEDGMVIAYVLRDYPLVGLKPVSASYGFPLRPIKEILGTGKKAIPFSEALRRDRASAVTYAAEDAVATARLAPIMDGRLREDPVLYRYYHEREKPAIPVIADMERRGVLVNPDELRVLETELSHRIDAKTRTLHGMLDAPEDFNRGSTQQLAALLMARGLKLKERTPTGNWKLDKDTLTGLIESQPDFAPVLERELQIRADTKLRSTYCQPLLDARDSTGRIHARFNQCVTNTSRLSSSDPNLQNIPIRGPIRKRMRSCFIARPGYRIVKADASQLEVRVFAYYTREPVLLDAYLHTDHDTAGPDGACLRCDVHQQVADALGVPRWRAKNTLFAAIYGADAPKLAATAGVRESESGPFLARMRERMPSLLTWPKTVAGWLYKQGYVETLLGFRSYFPMFGSVIPSERNAALREAGNLPIQGTGAGIIKEGMVQAEYLARQYQAELVLTVHDEVVYEVPTLAAKQFARALQRLFADVARIWLGDVPFRLDVEIGDTWGTGVPLDATA